MKANEDARVWEERKAEGKRKWIRPWKRPGSLQGLRRRDRERDKIKELIFFDSLAEGRHRDPPQ
jgi:hypothetical protein